MRKTTKTVHPTMSACCSRCISVNWTTVQDSAHCTNVPSSKAANAAVASDPSKNDISHAWRTIQRTDHIYAFPRFFSSPEHRRTLLCK